MRPSIQNVLTDMIQKIFNREPVSVRDNGFVIVLAVALVWLSVIGTGMGLIVHYSTSPGSVGTVPAKWPAESHIKPGAGRPTLVMFAHPQCPCTRASLDELDRLMATCQGRVDAQLWFIKPSGTAQNWTNTDLWAKASAIPGVTVHCDPTGEEAGRFHVETSGQTVLYDETGQLLFAGGITISRGHAGDNPGRSALEAFLENKNPAQVKTPVFGCSLFEAQCQQGQGSAVCKR